MSPRHKKILTLIVVMELLSVCVSQLIVLPSWETIQGIVVLSMQWSVLVCIIIILRWYRKNASKHHRTDKRRYLKLLIISLVTCVVYYYSLVIIIVSAWHGFMWPSFARDYYDENGQHLYEFSDCRMDACYSTITYRRLWSTPFLLFESEDKDIITY